MENMNKVLMLLSALMLMVMIYLTKELIDLGKEARIYKSDYATLHSVEYGMFNSDVWTDKIAKVVDEKIRNFTLNEDNRDEIKGYIQTIIDTLIQEAERAVKANNQGKRGFFDSLMGSTKQMITEQIIDFQDLRNRVPEFTDRVMFEIDKTENQERAKKMLRQKVKEFLAEKFKKSIDMTPFKSVIAKYDAQTLKACNSYLNSHMEKNREQMDDLTISILILALGIVILVIFGGILTTIPLFILSSTTVALLISGIMLPMLDVEAKINKLIFTILDTEIIFNNQILFFQSKSISDLVKLLLDSGEAKMILVGVLLVMFSVIFPTLKLIATTMYFYSKSIIGDNPVTRFFALKSTKWSMADVFVVSIFMAYLGLDGVVNSELRRLEKQEDPVNIITTNGTHLEVGFFLFLAFVAASFVLSILVERSKKARE
jgi:hypothetical protein